MENTEKEMSSEESLRVIQQMIHTAKRDFEDDSFHYLLWGWLVFAASLGQFILYKQGFEHSEITWLLMPVGAVIAFLYGRKQEKTERVKTYVSDFVKYVIGSMVISLFIVLCFSGKLQTYTYPIIMILYASMLFIMGGILQFKPLMFGGITNWILSIAAFFNPIEMQLLILALAVLLGYIIPGYLLSRRQKNTSIV